MSQSDTQVYYDGYRQALTDLLNDLKDNDPDLWWAMKDRVNAQAEEATGEAIIQD